MNIIPDKRTASVRWIYDRAQRPDRWMLTIVNLTWTVDDLKYHQWIFVIDARMYSAAEAVYLSRRTMISCRFRRPADTIKSELPLGIRVNCPACNFDTLVVFKAGAVPDVLEPHS